MLLDGGMMKRAWAGHETIYLKWRAGVEDRGQFAPMYTAVSS